MDDYSCTFPTGTTIGKAWRRRTEYRESDETATIVVGIYVETKIPDRIGILWLNVIFRHGPAPRSYVPSDWSNYQEWLRENGNG